MCGITGCIHLNGAPVEQHVLRQMTAALTHRGPDDAGYHTVDHVGLGMRRLSIIDVAGSPQPLYNENRTVSVVFNGEIFNYRELQMRLREAGHTLRTDGDGEVIAHLYEDHGERLVHHLRGQFAFAVWDEATQTLLLSRDRMGQKPLYYYHDERVFVFGSEIKALLQHPAVPRVSALQQPDKLALYLGYGYMPAPHTAFENIHALLPGHTLRLHDGRATVERYWTLPPVSDAMTHQPDALTRYAADVRDLLEEAVKLRLIADVPLGAFLSGGLDSSLIVALMQKHSSAPVKTFSIGFRGDDSYDESDYAAQVADYLGTEHTAFHAEPDVIGLLPQIVWHYDQPFADSSAIPTYLVSRMTREHVTVALTGDGGDELFAGYDRFYAATLLKRFERIPRRVWRGAARFFDWLPEATSYDSRIKRAGRFVRGAAQPASLAYFDWVRLFDAGQIARLTGTADAAGNHFAQLAGDGDLAQLLYANMATYLPDDLLVKADRSSMMASLEARAPFMDHHLVELAASLPLNLKLSGRVTKRILKEAARGLLPDEIIDRPKHGFGVPLGTWLRRDSQPVRDLLLGQPARDRNLLNHTAVEQMIVEHENGQRDHGFRLWALMSLEWWHRIFIDSATPAKPD